LDTEELVTVSEDASNDEPLRATKKRKVATKQTNTISHYFGVSAPKSRVEAKDDQEKPENLPVEDSKKRKTPSSETESKSIQTYCSLFPQKVAKKKVAEEECAVCMVEMCFSDGTSKWLIEQRPAKGMYLQSIFRVLANEW
jgi:A/G-specific adenine glycosylase